MAAALYSPHPLPLLSDSPVHFPGFKPRGIHRILQKRPQHTESKLELLWKLERPLNTEVPPPHTPGYLTWLEVSKLPPLLPLRPDQPYDSAVWRQLTAAPTSPEPPDPIPPPSRMEENTWSKFVRCRGMPRTEKDACALHLRSQGRAPPTDPLGNIIPPAGFKRYEPRGGRSITAEGHPITIAAESGFFTPPRYRHNPRKLTLQCNSPNHRQILQRYHELQRGARSMAPDNSRMTTPRIAAQLNHTNVKTTFHFETC
ncbi:testis-expressed protein 52 [Gastrophryne carolinensis]